MDTGWVCQPIGGPLQPRTPSDGHSRPLAPPTTTRTRTRKCSRWFVRLLSRPPQSAKPTRTSFCTFSVDCHPLPPTLHNDDERADGRPLLVVTDRPPPCPHQHSLVLHHSPPTLYLRNANPTRTHGALALSRRSPPTTSHLLENEQ